MGLNDSALRWLTALAAVLLAGYAGLASALKGPPAPSSSEALRSRVVALLQQPESFFSEAAWKQLGPEALPVLEQVAADPRSPSAWRTRAVHSMALVDHPEAVNRLRGLLEDPQPALRASAALALALCAGPEILSTLQPHLEDSRPEVREAVALAIGRLGGSPAQKALEERLPLEEELLVREAIQQGLTLVEP